MRGRGQTKYADRPSMPTSQPGPRFDSKLASPEIHDAVETRRSAVGRLHPCHVPAAAAVAALYGHPGNHLPAAETMAEQLAEK